MSDSLKQKLFERAAAEMGRGHVDFSDGMQSGPSGVKRKQQVRPRTILVGGYSEDQDDDTTPYKMNKLDNDPEMENSNDMDPNESADVDDNAEYLRNIPTTEMETIDTGLSSHLVPLAKAIIAYNEKNKILNEEFMYTERLRKHVKFIERVDLLKSKLLQREREIDPDFNIGSGVGESEFFSEFENFLDNDVKPTVAAAATTDSDEKLAATERTDGTAETQAANDALPNSGAAANENQSKVVDSRESIVQQLNEIAEKKVKLVEARTKELELLKVTVLRTIGDLINLEHGAEIKLLPVGYVGLTCTDGKPSSKESAFVTMQESGGANNLAIPLFGEFKRTEVKGASQTYVYNDLVLKLTPGEQKWMSVSYTNVLKPLAKVNGVPVGNFKIDQSKVKICQRKNINTMGYRGYEFNLKDGKMVRRQFSEGDIQSGTRGLFIGRIYRVDKKNMFVKVVFHTEYCLTFV